MTTARTLIEQSLKKINVLGQGQTLSSNEAADALNALNNMLDSWSVEGGLIYTRATDTFNATGAQSYTIGSGGDVNIVRPIIIDAITISQGGTDYSVGQIGRDSYTGITDKAVQGVPESFYYDNNSPLSNLYLWPVATAGYTVNIYSLKPLSSFTGLTTDVALPPSIARGIVLNLALELCPDYGIEPGRHLEGLANTAKTNILIYNTRNDSKFSTVDDALLGNDSFNIYSGQ